MNKVSKEDGETDERAAHHQSLDELFTEGFGLFEIGLRLEPDEEPVLKGSGVWTFRA